MRTLILALLIVAPTAQAADTQPIKGSSVREVTTSPSYDRPSSINGITRVKNLTDDVVFTSWVGSLGTGPVWLGFRFAGTRYVSKMTIIPGCAGSNRTFGEFGRPKNITLVAGKRETKVKVADRRRMQEIMVDPPLPAQSIKVLITETYKGRQQGVCISEIRFHEQTALGNVTEETRAKIENLAGRLHLGDSGAVVEALVRLGPAAVPRLSLALRDKSTRTQHNALKALYELGSPTAAEALVNYWKRNPPTELRMAALRALARTGDVRGIKYVVEIVGGDDYEAAEAAAEMTAQFGPDVLPALSGLLRGPHRDVRDRVLRALSTIRHPGVVALAAPFVSAPTSKLRAAAAQAIAGSGDEAGLVHLRKLSKDPHPTVRLAIARNADRFPPGEGQQLIARLARDADEFVARTAIETLARMPNGAQYLAKYIAEPDVPLGREAIALLAETGKAAGLDIMVEALRRGEMRYRKTIRLAIGQFGLPGYERLFRAALKDDRLLLDAEALLSAEPKIAVKLIGPQIMRDASSTPLWLVRTLGKARSAGSLAVLDRVWAAGTMSARLEVLTAWGQYPEAAVRDRLLAAVAVTDPVIRERAALAAAMAGIREVVPFLTRALKSQEIPMASAIEGLGRLQDRQVETFLISHFRAASSNMRERIAILHACKRINGKQCVRLLYGATNHPNRNIRFEALRLIGTQASYVPR